MLPLVVIKSHKNVVKIYTLTTFTPAINFSLELGTSSSLSDLVVLFRILGMERKEARALLTRTLT